MKNKKLSGCSGVPLLRDSLMIFPDKEDGGCLGEMRLTPQVSRQILRLWLMKRPGWIDVLCYWREGQVLTPLPLCNL